MHRVCSGISILFIAIATLLAGCGKGKSTDSATNVEKIISNKLIAITAAGEPVTSEELDAWYVKPPTGENAADIYVQAFASLSGDSGAPLFLAKNQNTIGLLIQAADKKACRYPMDLKNGYATDLPYLEKIKMSAQLLSLAANDAIAKGRPDTAIQMIEANVSLARSLQEEPLLMSRLVAVASLTLTFPPVEQLLSHSPLLDDQLVELSQAFHEADGLASFRRALIGERAFIIVGFQGTTQDWKAMDEAMQSTNASRFGAYKKTDAYYGDFNFALDSLNALVARADMEFPDALTVKPEAPDAKFVLSRMLLPALGNVFIRSAEATARLRLVQAALAIERYRLTHADALPDTLSDLGPGLTGNSLADPFDGKPLRYKKQPKGYLLYSIGRDGKDDGGKRQTVTKNGPTGDILFTVSR